MNGLAEHSWKGTPQAGPPMRGSTSLNARAKLSKAAIARARASAASAKPSPSPPLGLPPSFSPPPGGGPKPAGWLRLDAQEPLSAAYKSMTVACVTLPSFAAARVSLNGPPRAAPWPRASKAIWSQLRIAETCRSNGRSHSRRRNAAKSGKGSAAAVAAAAAESVATAAPTRLWPICRSKKASKWARDTGSLKRHSRSASRPSSGPSVGSAAPRPARSTAKEPAASAPSPAGQSSS
mmetsp:Transcript_67063/g.151608  ORF Transcript_67063/g.151608 Transcript_67063/m.151608 type:complete len:236 (-) Transcript_67063:711-1418(-)